MDPILGASLLGAGSNFLGGLFGGGGPTENQNYSDFFQGRLLRSQRDYQDLQNQFFGSTMGLRREGLGLQNQMSRNMLDTGRFKLANLRNTQGLVKDYLGSIQPYDVSGLMQGLQGQYQNQSKSLLSNFYKRGFGGTPAMSGALNNLYANQVALPTAQLKMNAQNQFTNNKMNLLSMLASLG